MRISKIEKWALIITSLLLWIGLALLAGGPIFSDEMLYLDAGLRNVAEPSYGNRYFHIYLQKLFVSILPTPLLGVRVFWGFLISLTASLVYFNARKLTTKSTILHGLMAVAFFFAFPLIREYSGEPAVDITAMTMTIIYLTVYLWGLKNPNKIRHALFILGILAFLNLKTKETTIFINILLIGLIEERFKENFSLKNLFVFFRPFLYGIVTGIGIFIVLDSIFLGKPFFAISPSTFGSIFSNYNFDPGFFFGPANWYKVYFLDDLMLPFILYLLGGIQLQKIINKDIRIVWVYPLVLAVFISWNMLKVPWGFIERFFFPALPVVAILAPQVIRFEFPRKKREWVWFFISILFSIALMLWMRSYWLNTAIKYTFDYARMIDAVYYPILMSLLLAILIWEKRSGWKWTIVHIFCVGSLLFSPLLNNYKYFVVYPKIKERYEVVFYPFNAFKDQLKILESDKIFVSADIKDSQDMLSRDPNDIVGMYNFFFDARINRNNVYLGYDETKLGSNLIDHEFSYVLLSENDVNRLEEAQLWETVKDKYQILDTDEFSSIFLLSH
ncbi:MAG: hypothetical protein Q7J07_05565 [Pelolinea sp.]|nr:hypothetical protein [Pelolinea sp.]